MKLSPIIYYFSQCIFSWPFQIGKTPKLNLTWMAFPTHNWNTALIGIVRHLFLRRTDEFWIYFWAADICICVFHSNFKLGWETHIKHHLGYIVIFKAPTQWILTVLPDYYFTNKVPTMFWLKMHLRFVILSGLERWKQTFFNINIRNTFFSKIM